MTRPRALSEARFDEVRAALNEIRDPCSIAAQTPVGLWDMGLVTAVEIRGGAVDVSVRPTFPGCLFVGHFDHEIRARLAALPWCLSVGVAIDSSTVWTEADMAPAAKRLLEQRRAAARVAAKAMTRVASVEDPRDPSGGRSAPCGVPSQAARPRP